MGEERTLRGCKMAPWIRRAVVEGLSEPEAEGLGYKKAAKRIGISLSTLKDYLIEAVRAEIEERRRNPLQADDLLAVDRAMLAKAKEGNVQAAKIVYARAVGLGGGEKVPTLEEIEGELAKLKG